MKKGQTYEGIIEKVNFPNKAIITVIDNHTVEKTEAKADSDIDSNIADTKKDSDSNVSISKNFESNLSGLQEQIPAEMVKVQVKGGIEGQKVRFCYQKKPEKISAWDDFWKLLKHLHRKHNHRLVQSLVSVADAHISLTL